MLIEFGQVKLQLLILLIYPIGILIAKKIAIDFIANPIYYLFLFFLSHFLALIPLIYIKIRKRCSKKKKKLQEDFNISSNKNGSTYIDKADKEGMQNQLEILKGKMDGDRKRNKILIFFLIGFLYFSTYYFFYVINYIETADFYGNVSIATEVIYFSLFNWVVLGNRLYSHHLFSMILITISIISLYILLTINYIIDNNDWDAWNDFIFPTLLSIIVYCLYCYCLIKAKYYMEIYFISAYKLIFYLGLFCLGLLLITEPILYYIPCSNKNPICDSENGHLLGFFHSLKILEKKDIFYSLALSIFHFLTALGLWLTVKELSPCHFITSDSIIPFELNILFDFYNTKKKLIDNILFYVFSVITIFGCFIYNEILIVNICHLEFNTRKEILKRQSKDLKETNCELSHYNTTTTLSYTNEASSSLASGIIKEYDESINKSLRSIDIQFDNIDDLRDTKAIM